MYFQRGENSWAKLSANEKGIILYKLLYANTSFHQGLLSFCLRATGHSSDHTGSIIDLLQVFKKASSCSLSHIPACLAMASLTLSLTAQVIYDLAFSIENYSKKFKFNKSQNFSISGAVSCESILLKVFLNSMMLF